MLGYATNRWRGRRRRRSRTPSKLRWTKPSTELRATLSAVSEELTKQHAEELRAQEERLIAKHHEELEKAVKAAKESAPTPAPAPAATGPTAEEQKAAIDAAVAAALSAKEAEQRTKHQTDIEKAVESGRLEGTMKLRLKDTQLVHAQNKIKELELQIEEWRKAGVLPGDSSAPIVPVPVQSTSAVSPTTIAPSSIPSPTTTAPAARGGAPAPPMRKLSFRTWRTCKSTATRSRTRRHRYPWCCSAQRGPWSWFSCCCERRPWWCRDHGAWRRRGRARRARSLRRTPRWRSA